MKGLHFVRTVRPSKLPRWYIYAWRGGPLIAKIDMHNKPVVPPKTLERVFATLDNKRRANPATLRSLSREWRSCDPGCPSSPEWIALTASTKRTWGAILEQIEDKWGDLPLDAWNDPNMATEVAAWRDSRSATPRAADIRINALRALLEFGQLHGRVTTNVASQIQPLYRACPRAAIIWTDEEIARFTQVARQRDRIHVLDGLRLAALTGLGREDLVTLAWDEVGNSGIAKVAHLRRKGPRRQITLPLIPGLEELLDELRSRQRIADSKTVLVNSYGMPWSSAGFGGSFNRLRDEAGIVHRDERSGKLVRKHLEDVRGTFCTKLLTSMDHGDRDVAEMMGWSVRKVATIRRLYVAQRGIGQALGERRYKAGAS